MRKRKVLFITTAVIASLLLISFLLLIASNLSLDNRIKASTADQSNLLFMEVEEFEKATLENKNSVELVGNKSGIFTVENTKSFIGSNSLKVNTPLGNEGLVAYKINIGKQKNLNVEISFYDENTDKSVGTVIGISNDTVSKYVIMGIPPFDKKYYYYRINQKWIKTDILRTPGWHKFVVTLDSNNDMYSSFDDKSLKSLGVNKNVENITYASFGRNSNIKGYTLYDSFVAYSLNDGLEGRYFEKYFKDVFDAYKDIKISEKSYSLNDGRVRAYIEHAQMYIYMYKTTKNKEYFILATEILSKVVDNYSSWSQKWLSTVPSHLILYTVTPVWNELDQGLKNKIYSSLVLEADFWVNVFDQIKNDPNGKTVSERVRRKSAINISVMSSEDLYQYYKTDMDRLNLTKEQTYLFDTKAEESASVALFLANMYSAFKNDSKSNKWNEVAKCFAFHTLSKGETYCGVTTRTISDGYVLGNHGIYPSPLYAIAVSHSLGKASELYIHLGEAVPSEFSHNNENGISSVFNKVNLFGCSDLNTFTILEVCGRGRDWGDQSIWLSLSVFINDVSGTKEISKEFKTRILRYFYIKNLSPLAQYPTYSKLLEINENTDSGTLQKYWLQIERIAQLTFNNYMSNSNYRYPLINKFQR